MNGQALTFTVHPPMTCFGIHFFSYCAGTKVFCKITSETIENQFKNLEKSEFVRKRPDASKCIRRHPNASQQVRMDPNGSQHVPKPRKTCGNFEKTHENFEKLRENVYKNFFPGVVSALWWRRGVTKSSNTWKLNRGGYFRQVITNQRR